MRDKDLILVSVIIPVYNIERYLQQCIDSVVTQSLLGIELILVDDGSTDFSGCICDSYLCEYTFVKVIHQANLGVSTARNVGLKMAKGKYVFFLDSDDWLDYNLLAELYDLASKNDADFLVSGYVVEWLDSGKKELIGVDEDYHYLKSSAAFKNALILMEQNSLSCGSIAKLYRNSILVENDIRFPVGVCWCEDALFNLDFFEKSRSVVVSQIKGYHVRRESALVSLTRRFVPNMFEIESKLYSKRLASYDLFDINDEQFIRFAKTRYSLALMWCLSNLYKKDSTLNQRERLLSISLIYNELKSKNLFLYIPRCRFNNLALMIFRFFNLYSFDLLMTVFFKIRSLLK